MLRIVSSLLEFKSYFIFF